MRGGSDRRNVHELTGEVVDGTEEHRGDRVGVRAQYRDDVLGAQHILAGSGLQAQHLGLRVHPARAHVRSDRVGVGGERIVLNHDLGA